MLTKTFKTFPEFTKLTLADRVEFEELTKDFPPLSDMCFTTLILWWEVMGEVRISRLHDNIVMSYWMPGDETKTGLSLLGTKQVDQSICTIFDHMRNRGELPRIVSVPEFTIDNIRYPEMFKFTPQRGDDEYILSVSRFNPLENLPSYRRVRIRRFLRSIGEENLAIRSIDLRLPENRSLLLECAASWPKQGINDLGKIEQCTLEQSIVLAAKFDIKNVCLFVDGELSGFCLYHVPRGKNYAFVHHARVDYGVPRTFDYMVHAFASYMAKQGIKHVNIHADFGFAPMRAVKLALRPVNFFRKYTIEPS